MEFSTEVLWPMCYSVLRFARHLVNGVTCLYMSGMCTIEEGDIPVQVNEASITF
jgi:hypothetical protein